MLSKYKKEVLFLILAVIMFPTKNKTSFIFNFYTYLEIKEEIY